jgi:DNA-binding beta-propeller fold protein YncE
LVDRTLDIVAGRKAAEISNDVVQLPYAVTTDPAHRVYVTDVGDGKVPVFDFASAKYSVLQEEGDHRRNPFGIAADGVGNIYVTDNGSGAILIYDQKGKFRTPFPQGWRRFSRQRSRCPITPKLSTIFSVTGG